MTKSRDRPRKRTMRAALAAALVAIASSAAAEPVKALLESNAELGVFTRALKQSGLWSGLEAGGPVTVFAPSDRALRDEGATFLLAEVLTTEPNRQRLSDVMAYHVHVGLSLSPEDISEHRIVAGDGTCFLLYRSGSAIRMGPEAAVVRHIAADNGGVYVIDRLLWRTWDGRDLCGSAAGKEQARIGRR